METALVANYAAEQFSATQGKNQWRYLYQTPDSNWGEMPHYSATDNGAWESKPGQYVSAFTMAPGSCTAGCDASGVARVWVAVHPGTVSIRGLVVAAGGESGTGVTAAINLVSGRNVIPIWPRQGGRPSIEASNHAGLATDVDNIQVAAGDTIRFEVHGSTGVASDAVSWTPSIGYVTNKP